MAGKIDLRMGHVLAALLALTLAGCAPEAPTAPRVVCQTGDQIGCQQAADLAWKNAPVAVGMPSRLIVTPAALPDCPDKRANVCPWNVDVEYSDNGESWSMPIPVMRANTGEWLLVRMVKPIDEASPAASSGPTNG